MDTVDFGMGSLLLRSGLASPVAHPALSSLPCLYRIHGGDTLLVHPTLYGRAESYSITVATGTPSVGLDAFA